MADLINIDKLILSLAQEVIDGKKTLLQIERHLTKRGFETAVAPMMERIREEVSRRKHGNG